LDERQRTRRSATQDGRPPHRPEREVLTMNRIVLLFLALAVSLRAADQASPGELKMREALRNTMLQLRTAETERANLQAAQAEMDQKNKTLASQVEALTKQIADD